LEVLLAEATHSIFVDIAPHHLRFIEASKSGSDFTIHNAGVIPIDSLAKGKLGESVKKAINPNSLSFASAAVSIWTSAIVVRRITMPLMADKDLRSAIGFEAEKHIPYPINECVLDHITLRKMQGSKQMELMLIVGKKDMINERRLAMEEIGLSVNFIDIHPFSLSNAFSAFQPPSTGATAFVHVGDVVKGAFAGTNFVAVTKAGQPQLVRDLGSEAAGLSDAKVSSEAIDALIEKIKASIEFYENSTEEEIGELLVAGQGLSDQAIIDAVATGAEKKVRVWGFVEKIKFESKTAEELLKKNEREFLVCMGIAARALSQA